MSSEFSQLAPGVTIKCRDEYWLVTGVSQSKDGYRVRVRGVSNYVRDTPATFFTALDHIEVFDPANVKVVPDESPKYRHTKLWLESTLRRTPVPVEQEKPEISRQMLLDVLDYQIGAVEQALSNDQARPRILLADAVGLGKTLEIGMILAELIRRGQGERILVVTPKHVMEQFQQELWTRFAIPLIRLDSLGIQRVRQKLPASKNPFTYFPRVIVSMDTLKSPKYRAQLQKVRWDAVVIDEIHNATNAGSQNNELARALAPTTDSLILASATPHNGKEESFKEILRLLDPLSVYPDGTIDGEAAKKLIIRRHRNSPEVASVVGEKWAERNEPKNILVEASAEENAVSEEISNTWLNDAETAENGERSSKVDRLFPWTLVKAFLSSPAALAESLDSRIKTVSKREDDSAHNKKELANLKTLQKLNAEVTAENSNKFATLVNYLQEIGVKKGSETRVAIFSERVATLHWLKENLEEVLELDDGVVEVMHGGLPDTEQLALIDEFKRSDTNLRILITGDVASEGVNLHHKCHNLVHYDIPWSLIRIQQRNGRIDRYGQQKNPQIAALLLDPADEDSIGELHVLTRLMEREFEANKYLGDVAPLMGKYNTKAEEDTIREVLANHRDFDSTVRSAEEVVSEARHAVQPETTSKPAKKGLSAFDVLMRSKRGAEKRNQADSSMANGQLDKPRTRQSLYKDQFAYLEDALNEGFKNSANNKIELGGVGFKESGNGIVSLTPPKDLQRRFDLLPQDYVSSRKVKDRLELAITSHTGEDQLKKARNAESDNTWPKAHYLGPLHPVLEWAADVALAKRGQDSKTASGREEIPAIEGNVDYPTVLIMTNIMNKQGRVLSRAFIGVQDMFGTDSAAPMPFEQIPDVFDWLRRIGLNDDAFNNNKLRVPEGIDEAVAAAVKTASTNIGNITSMQEKIAKDRIDKWRDRQQAWENHGTGQQLLRVQTKGEVQKEKELLESMVPDRSLIRPLLVILPKEA